MNVPAVNPPRWAITDDGAGAATLTLEGIWVLQGPRAVPFDADALAEAGAPQILRIEARALAKWDTALMVFLQNVAEAVRQSGIRADWSGLPKEARSLLELAEAVPENKDSRKKGQCEHFVYCLGKEVLKQHREMCDLFAFVGGCCLACLKVPFGKARFRARDFWLVVQQTGAEALPIVGLLAFLVGLILAFVGAIQLQAFGASIFVANLVGLSMVREMGVIITGVIMSGRTGAAFAATIASMKANEEIAALQTLGFSPMEFLVVPRILALLLMMPLLVILANFIGMLGGLVVGTLMLDITPQQYLEQTKLAVDLQQASTGVAKSFVFAILVAAAGCRRGLQAEGNSEGVGSATTSAVVTGISAIIIADAVFAVVFQVLGI